MTARFDHLSVSAALERSLKNNGGQLTAKHSALVDSARVLAARIAQSGRASCRTRGEFQGGAVSSKKHD